jgi:hypothetical protein
VIRYNQYRREFGKIRIGDWPIAIDPRRECLGEKNSVLRRKHHLVCFYKFTASLASFEKKSTLGICVKRATEKSSNTANKHQRARSDESRYNLFNCISTGKANGESADG